MAHRDPRADPPRSPGDRCEHSGSAGRLGPHLGPGGRRRHAVSCRAARADVTRRGFCPERPGSDARASQRPARAPHRCPADNRRSPVPRAPGAGLPPNRGRGSGQPARWSGGAGRLNDHPAAGQEPVPRFPPHARSQGSRSSDGPGARSATLQGRDPRGVPQRCLPGTGRRTRHPRGGPGRRVAVRKGRRPAGPRRVGDARGHDSRPEPVLALRTWCWTRCSSAE